MSIKEKIAKLVDIKSESDCSFSVIEKGWIINDVQIEKEEFEEILPLILRDITSEKKRTNFLIVLKKLEKDAIIYLPFITNIVLNTWFEEKKFVQKFIEMINTVTGDISDYIDNLNDHKYLSDLGSLLEIDKQYDISLTCWKKAVKLSPSYFFGWIGMSFNHARLGDSKAAVKALWDGVSKNNYDIPTGEAQGKVDKKYRFEMKSLLDLLQRKEKKNYMLSYIRGLLVSYFHKDYKSAIDSFKKSMKLNPLFIESEIQLAKTLGKSGDKIGQIKAYKKIVKRDPKNTRAIQELGLFYKDRVDYDLAVYYFEKLHDLEPKNKKWLDELAFLYRTSSLKAGARSKKPWQRNLRKSYNYYIKLVEVAPYDVQSIDDFNGLLIELGRYEEAKDILFNYMTLSGPSVEFMRKLRTAYSWLKLPFDERKVLEEINYRRNKDSSYSIIVEFLSTVRPDIDIALNRIAKVVEFPEKRMHELLIQLVEEYPGIGEYIKLEQVFIRKQDSDGIFRELKAKYSTCYYCGMPVDATNLSNCPNCDKEIIDCNLCKSPISYGEELGQCILCESFGHLKHLEDWVKKHGICPTCLQEISLQGVVKVKKD
jgi:tetratricopeptide (TPR) repeat protein